MHGRGGQSCDLTNTNVFKEYSFSLLIKGQTAPWSRVRKEQVKNIIVRVKLCTLTKINEKQ